MRIGFFIGLMGFLGVAGWYLYPKYQAWLDLRSADDNIMAIDENASSPLFIPSGSTAENVADLLVDENLISDKDKFLHVASRLSYAGKNVFPGFYIVKGSWSVRELVQNLRLGKARQEVQISTDGVHTLKQLAGQVSRSIELDSAAFYDYLTSENVLEHYGFKEETMISLFFPNKYRTNWASSEEALLEQFAGYYKAFWTDERKQKAQELGYSQSQITTLGSVVWGECSNHNKSEWPTVAGLYINRLKRGMKLESDPTVKFALGDFDKERVYYADLEVQSPYNTYYVKGLPPGPIGPVPQGVIDAVLNYEKHNYIFMCAKPGGWKKGHNFAETGAQHSRNAALYHEWANKNNIR